MIVGAGPVGLTFACVMAGRNISFRIIERSAAPLHEARAKAVQPHSPGIDDLGENQRANAEWIYRLTVPEV